MELEKSSCSRLELYANRLFHTRDTRSLNPFLKSAGRVDFEATLKNPIGQTLPKYAQDFLSEFTWEYQFVPVGETGALMKAIKVRHDDNLRDSNLVDLFTQDRLGATINILRILARECTVLTSHYSTVYNIPEMIGKVLTGRVSKTLFNSMKPEAEEVLCDILDLVVTSVIYSETSGETSNEDSHNRQSIQIQLHEINESLNSAARIQHQSSSSKNYGNKTTSNKTKTTSSKASDLDYVFCGVGLVLLIGSALYSAGTKHPIYFTLVSVGLFLIAMAFDSSNEKKQNTSKEDSLRDYLTERLKDMTFNLVTHADPNTSDLELTWPSNYGKLDRLKLVAPDEATKDGRVIGVFNVSSLPKLVIDNFISDTQTYSKESIKKALSLNVFSAITPTLSVYLSNSYSQALKAKVDEEIAKEQKRILDFFAREQRAREEEKALRKAQELISQMSAVELEEYRQKRGDLINER